MKISKSLFKIKIRCSTDLVLYFKLCYYFPTVSPPRTTLQICVRSGIKKRVQTARPTDMKKKMWKKVKNMDVKTFDKMAAARHTDTHLVNKFYTLRTRATNHRNKNRKFSVKCILTTFFISEFEAQYSRQAPASWRATAKSKACPGADSFQTCPKRSRHNGRISRISAGRRSPIFAGRCLPVKYGGGHLVMGRSVALCLSFFFTDHVYNELNMYFMNSRSSLSALYKKVKS